jgi:hypothetical protein
MVYVLDFQLRAGADFNFFFLVFFLTEECFPGL